MQNLERRSLPRDAAALKDVATVGDIFESVQVMCGCNHRFRAVFPGLQQADDLGLAGGI
jgi:hypothetical protein